MKTYQIDENTLNKILEMLDGYCVDGECLHRLAFTTPEYDDFEIKDLIKELKDE